MDRDRTFTDIRRTGTVNVGTQVTIQLPRVAAMPESSAATGA